MHPWFEYSTLEKQWETILQCAVLTHTVFPFVWGWLALEGQIFPQCSLSGAPQWALWFWQRVQLYPLRSAFTNILCTGATGIKHRQPPRVPNFSFHTSTFQMTTSRITRNSSKFLALEVPMIPAGMQKRLSLFFPLKIMYFPGTVQMSQMRQMRDLFWPTHEKTFSFSARALRFSYNVHKMSVSKEP